MNQRPIERRADGMEFSVQTAVDREGREVKYLVHEGPSRAERRDARFRPRMVEAQRERAMLRQLAAESRSLAARRIQHAGSLAA